MGKPHRFKVTCADGNTHVGVIESHDHQPILTLDYVQNLVLLAHYGRDLPVPSPAKGFLTIYPNYRGPGNWGDGVLICIKGATVAIAWPDPKS